MRVSKELYVGEERSIVTNQGNDLRFRALLEGRLVHTSRFCEEIRDNCTPESTTHRVALVHGVPVAVITQSNVSPVDRGSSPCMDRMIGRNIMRQAVYKVVDRRAAPMTNMKDPLKQRHTARWNQGRWRSSSSAKTRSNSTQARRAPSRAGIRGSESKVKHPCLTSLSKLRSTGIPTRSRGGTRDKPGSRQTNLQGPEMLHPSCQHSPSR